MRIIENGDSTWILKLFELLELFEILKLFALSQLLMVLELSEPLDLLRSHYPDRSACSNFSDNLDRFRRRKLDTKLIPQCSMKIPFVVKFHSKK